MNTTSTVTPISETPKQPQQRQTAKDIIAANVKSLIEQLEAGHSDALTAYLDAMSRFHNYSFGNILEIARQRPTATRVAGLYAWNQLGRKVKKGEKGHSHSRPHRRHQAQEGRGSQQGHHQAEHPRLGWLPQCLRLRCGADRRRRASHHAGDDRHA